MGSINDQLMASFLCLYKYLLHFLAFLFFLYPLQMFPQKEDLRCINKTEALLLILYWF